ncbi:MAG TPA: EthD family reductase [Streptosporangiaceae bacterium]|nr:EthD family reductase [Streptosporangiaceae bacterium]
MTVKLVVLDTHPADPEAFDQHYLGVHMPLVRSIPGLQRAESGRVDTALDGGEQSWYRIASLYSADRSALDAAFSSLEGQATAADYGKTAPPGSRMFTETVDR